MRYDGIKARQKHGYRGLATLPRTVKKSYQASMNREFVPAKQKERRRTGEVSVVVHISAKTSIICANSIAESQVNTSNNVLETCFGRLTLNKDSYPWKGRSISPELYQNI
jgi:hypothetical protein